MRRYQGDFSRVIIEDVRLGVACPTITAFYGILIRLFFNDHPPHFYARYEEFEATIEIGTLNILKRTPPARALRESAIMHIEEFLTMAALPWERAARADRDPDRPDLPIRRSC